MVLSAFEAVLGNFVDQVCILAGVTDHLDEGSVVLDELVRLSDFDDPSPAHHNHLVVVSDGVQSVGDGDDSGVLELGVDALLDEVVGFHVHVRCDFIQDQELVVAKQCPRQAQQLLLPH